MTAAEDVIADDAATEALARLSRVELRMNDLDALFTPTDAVQRDDDRAAAPGPAVTAYPDLPAWVVEYFARTYTRPLGGEWRWCPRWEEHPEAVVRLEALWLSWEKLRADSDLGMAMWLRDHLDPQLTVLLSGRGPFARCSPSRHESTDGLPVQVVHKSTCSSARSPQEGQGARHER